MRTPLIFFSQMKTHIRKKKERPIAPEEMQLDLFWRLQERPDTPHSKRVEKILELLSSLGTDLSPTEKGQALMGLHSAMGRYKWLARVAFTADGYCVIRTPANRETLSKDEEWEYAAVGILLNIIPSIGERPRIVRCEECKKWLFREKRSDKRWCSGVCKQRHYERDPETRAKKLEAMRKRYAKEKERDRKGKAAVGYTKPPKRKAGTR
jgi:hypothetical protein